MKIRVADLFEITLSDNRKAIGHYVYFDDKNGPFIQVFDYIVQNTAVNVNDAILRPYLFPPVITGLHGAIRRGFWKVIGKQPITKFEYPKFISSFWDDKNGEVINWFLYDGANYFKL